MPTRLKCSVPVSALAAAIGLPFEGDDLDIESVQSLDNSRPRSLTFAVRPVTTPLPETVAVLSKDRAQSSVWIAAPQPRLSFVKALTWLDREVGFERPDSEPRIHPTVQIGSGVSIGKSVVIGAGTVLEHNIRIADGVQIGRDCRIKSGTVIGEDGFGFERDTDGTPLRMLHLGGVILGDRVEIGSLNTVCQGTLAPTIVEDDVKTDDHVHIAHNCRIKRKALITACVEFSGGVTVGEEAWIGPNSSVRDGLTIGDRAFVGLGAVVIRSVPPDTTVAGSPARPLERRS